jgi:hypothetical protein
MTVWVPLPVLVTTKGHFQRSGAGANDLEHSLSCHHALYVGGSNPDQAVIFRQPAHGVGLRVALDEMVVNKFNPRLCPSNFPV